MALLQLQTCNFDTKCSYATSQCKPGLIEALSDTPHIHPTYAHGFDPPSRSLAPSDLQILSNPAFRVYMAHLASIHPCMQSLRKEPPPPLQSNPPKFPFHLNPPFHFESLIFRLNCLPPTLHLHPYPHTNFPLRFGQHKLCLVTSTSFLHCQNQRAAAEGDQFPMEKCQGFCGTECVKGGWDSKRDFEHNFCSTQYAHNESPAGCASQAQSQTADANDYVEHFRQLNRCPCIVPGMGVVPSWDSSTSTSSSRVPFTAATFSTISEHDLYCHYVPGRRQATIVLSVCLKSFVPVVLEWMVNLRDAFILNISSAELRFWLTDIRISIGLSTAFRRRRSTIHELKFATIHEVGDQSVFQRMRQRSIDMATAAWCGMLGVRTLVARSFLSPRVCGDFDLAPSTFALGLNGSHCHIFYFYEQDIDISSRVTTPNGLTVQRAQRMVLLSAERKKLVCAVRATGNDTMDVDYDAITPPATNPCPRLVGRTSGHLHDLYTSHDVGKLELQITLYYLPRTLPEAIPTSTPLLKTVVTN
ncbi:uncharacterized protein LACBIDRAFT_335630 [Laccaria bicolor S238N-H82]|uniref:Predicted protein n=1 Tax=Laccaria bicolor (strain S238N-H82 / ATCC MYA-4686) TaxID=486041 RepID=B0E2W7_LACBS|nr:uncharacterized protein LACBIDRAFT_335630 [Laccaria bicolor S238N-H82]EDQ98804.1 predicted protein [Laccaria bicolor S238N-H82]|eukprot:XP_001890534.1 predicted protein [Laccaria bicolor S238N-H82]